MLSRTLIGPEAPIGAPPSRSVWAWPGSSLSLAGSRSLRSRGGSARLPVQAHPAGAMMKKSHAKLAYRDRMCAVGRRADIERPYSRTSATPSDRRNAECREWALIGQPSVWLLLADRNVSNNVEIRHLPRSARNVEQSFLNRRSHASKEQVRWAWKMSCLV